MTNYFAAERSLVAGETVEVKLRLFSPRPDEGDRLIVFKRDDEGAITFVGTSEVLSATDRDVREEGEVIRFRTLSFASESVFDEPRTLALLAGSLQKVYRFLDPERHFARPIVKLDFDDYQAIEQNIIATYRTVFRYLFSSLPLPIQAEFVRLHIEQYPHSASRIVSNYRDLAGPLIKFVDGRVAPMLRLLTQVGDLKTEELGEGIPSVHDLYLGTEASAVEKTGSSVSNIAIGRAGIEAANFLRRSRFLNTDVDDMTSLLSEALEQLATATESERPWNDAIF